MECIVCTRELPDGAAYCHGCGAPQARALCRGCDQLLVPGSAFCSWCGRAVEPADVGPGGTGAAGVTTERRVTSILFADLVAFTTLAEQRDSEDVRTMLGEYFEVCAGIVRRYGGTVEKFIGDAVVAVWGVPVTHEDDAERAVRAGLELVAGVSQLGERLGLPQLSLRVGIVTGEVAAVPSAIDQGMVVGDPVNTASRVQSTAGPGEVWVDAATRQLSAAAVTYFDVGMHPLKGKVDPVHLFRAGTVVAAPGASQRVDGLVAELVGRARHLRLLRELFHAAVESGRPGLVVLDGDAGVGKSRLGWELENYVDGLGTAVTWHRGRCLSYGDGVAFWALAEVFRARLGVVEDDAPAVVAAALEHTLRDTAAEETERRWIAARVGSLLGAEPGEFAREDLFAAWATFLERTGAGGPVVLLVDDAHHADDGLLDFVDHVVTHGRFALLVLLLGRPELLERRPRLGGRRCTVLPLAPLPDAALRELVGNLVAGLDDKAVEGLVQRADGIPLFAVETVRALIDRGDVGPVGGRYVVMPGRTVDLDRMGAPASLHALVAARLDALSPPERRVLADASVLGQTFTREGIGVLANDVPGLDAVLMSLQRRELVAIEHEGLPPRRGRYRFVQLVVRQVAYSTLARRDRKTRHLAVADHLLSQAEGLDEVASVVARHLLDAANMSAHGDRDTASLRTRASELLVTAGTRACALGAFADGLRAFREALEIVDEPRGRAGLLASAAKASLSLRHFRAAAADAQRSVGLYDDLGDAVGAADASYVMATALGALGRHDEGAELATARLQTLAGVTGAERTVGRLSRIAAQCLLVRGREHEGTAHLDNALRMSDLADDPETKVGATFLLGVQQRMYGSVDVASAIFGSAADLARDRELWAPLTSALLNQAHLLAPQDLPRALDLFDQALAKADDHGLPRHTDVDANRCTLLWLAGRWEELRGLLAMAAAICDESSEPDPLLAKLAASADLLLVWSGAQDRRLVEHYTGEETTEPALVVVEQYRAFCGSLVAGRDEGSGWTDAVALVDAEIELSRLIDDLHAYWPLTARLAMAAGDLPTLAALLDRLAPWADSDLPLSLRAHRRITRAWLETRTGVPDGAAFEAALEKGITELGDAGCVVWEAHAHEELGAWLLARGRGRAALDHLTSARSTYAGLGARRWLARVADLEAGRPGRQAQPGLAVSTTPAEPSGED